MTGTRAVRPFFNHHIMKKLLLTSCLSLLTATSSMAAYEPTQEIIEARKEFADHGFGIFIHWGVYSMFAQGEWYLNSGISAEEYAKCASAFYPANFNAAE